MTRLPWPETRLGALAEFVMGQAPPGSSYNDDGVGYPFVRAGEFGRVRPALTHWTTAPLKHARESDVLVCVVGATAGKVNLGADCAIGRSVAAVRPGPDLDQRFLYHFLSAQVPALRSGSRGSAQGVIARADLSDLVIPLPALRDQRRTVEILEDHLSRLDAANDYLDAARRRLEAIEQVTLERLTSVGVARRLGDIAQIQGGIQKQAKRRPVRHTFPFLRVANVTKAGLDLSDVHQVELFDGELPRYRLLAGDLLVVEGNGSSSQIGRAATWDGSIENCVHQNHLIRVRPTTDLLPEYLEAAWNAAGNRRGLTALASSTSGLYTLSVGKLKTLTLRVPPREDQARVVEQVRAIRDARTSLSDALATGRQREARLRRSLLAAAFSGKLTGQSADVGPVEEMALA